MKKIISSAIAVAMLSSTVAMAAYVAPTPQIDKISATQTFDTFNSISTWKDDYEIGKDKLGVHSWNNEVTVVPNPFNDNTEDTDPDKVISMACPTVNTDDNDTNNIEGETGFAMSPGVTLNDGDIFKVSFDAVLTDPDASNQNHIVFQINGKDVFDLYNHAYLDKVPTWTNVSEPWVFSTESPSGDAFKNYEITFDKAANTIGIKIGGYCRLFNIKDDAPFNISSIKTVALKFQHKKAVTQGTFYLNNLSYETVRATSENLETFDALLPITKPYGTAFSGELPKVNYSFPNGATITTTQTIEPERGNVLGVDENHSNNSYIAMPLNYTIDNDDVFTFKFDYAQDRHSEKQEYNQDVDQCFVYLNNFSTNNGEAAARNFKVTSVNDSTLKYTSANSLLFAVKGGQIVLFDKRYGWPRAGLTKKFSTVTVVIDNSDDAYDNKCTLAIYVDGELYENTKWYLEDNEGATTSFKNIDGVSIRFQGSSSNRYFDNMYATLADKKISVADGVASYTNPVVYTNETAANADTNSIFVKAYYDASGRLLSADTASAEPGNYSRTATTELNKPANTARTKVFRWDSLTGIKKLTPAYDSNPPSSSGE